MAWDRRPDHRTRRAYLHLSYSCVHPFGPAALVTHDPNRTQCSRSTPVLHRVRSTGSAHDAMRNCQCRGHRGRMSGYPSRPVSFRSSLRARSAIGQRRIIRPPVLSAHQISTSATMRNAARHAIRRDIRDLRPLRDPSRHMNIARETCAFDPFWTSCP